ARDVIGFGNYISRDELTMFSDERKGAAVAKSLRRRRQLLKSQFVPTKTRDSILGVMRIRIAIRSPCVPDRHLPAFTPVISFCPSFALRCVVCEARGFFDCAARGKPANDPGSYRSTGRARQQPQEHLVL